MLPVDICKFLLGNRQLSACIRWPLLMNRTKAWISNFCRFRSKAGQCIILSLMDKAGVTNDLSG
jgi:hypothetical protein